MTRDVILPGWASVLTSTAAFTLGVTIGTDDWELLAVWPGVFILAGIQHLFVAAPAHLLITRFWGPVDQSSLWSFGLWGASLATAPWASLFLSDDAKSGFAHMDRYSGLLALIAMAGAVGGATFGQLVKQPCRVGC